MAHENGFVAVYDANHLSSCTDTLPGFSLRLLTAGFQSALGALRGCCLPSLGTPAGQAGRSGPWGRLGSSV